MACDPTLSFMAIRKERNKVVFENASFSVVRLKVVVLNLASTIHGVDLSLVTCIFWHYVAYWEAGIFLFKPLFCIVLMSPLVYVLYIIRVDCKAFFVFNTYCSI